jgi:hypothetical protein
MKEILAGVAFAALLPSWVSAEPRRNGGSPASVIHLERLKQRATYRNLYFGPIGNSENSGIRNGETAEPGDFAVTDSLSRGRASNPTGQPELGTSNAPAPNNGGE